MVFRERILVALGVCLLLAAPAAAQYFGQNKVQYDRFDFQILKTPHFDVYYYAAEADAAHIAARLAERWYARLSTTLHHTFTRRQPVILYASHSHFTQTAIVSGSIPDGIGGFTDHLAGRVVLPFSAGLGETDHVLGHEIVHAFQRDILKKRGRSLAMLPLWFVEGLAEYLSVGELDANTRMWLRDSIDAEQLPTIAQLDDPKWFPYRYGQALWTFLASTYGEGVVTKALNSTAKGGAAGRLRDATGNDIPTLSKEWHEFIRATVVADRDAAASLSKTLRVIGSEPHGGRMYVAPALSPDGRYVVFLSERDGYSVDVFLADASTGGIVRKLLSTAADAHFDSLQFIDSAGAWDASGRRFALATLRDGRAALTIFDMPEGPLAEAATVRREIPVPGVDQIFSPTWSPDASRIAFSALKGGFADLFAIDLLSGDVRPLTADPYSDLQPSWSPDGSRLVFATDRFSSSLAALSFGRYQLATLDVASGAIRALGGSTSTPGGKNIDPHWSPDGSRVYFVSDRGGASNLYHLDLATGHVVQVTDVATGVSGITALSPATSIGAGGSRAALSVYARGAYEIRTIDLDATAASAGAPLPATQLVTPIAADVPALSNETFASQSYKPRLTLAQLGSPYLTAGGGALGSFFRAGVSMGFGDLLGQQEIVTAVQVGKESTDNAVVAAYMNRRSRWNWGVSGGRIPALVGGGQTTVRATDGDGNAVVVRTSDALQQIHRQAGGVIAYPFNRAQRIEGSVGIDSTVFDERTNTVTLSSAGQTIGDVTVHRTAAPVATTVQAGAALVYDTAVFGVASPVLGERYRVAISPSMGDLRFVTMSADYRRYVMPVRPFTIAVRAQVESRTGPAVGDPRLLPLVWNLRDLVRGYDTDNVTVRTSRFAVANAELRFPIAALLGRPVTATMPFEGLAFADCGRFWIPGNGSQSICSAGAGARVNAAGLVFEFDAVRRLGPFADGWRLGINFLPGF
ncbi:MAG TPA: hypothetical protein VKH42_07355 [Vicinamibacterales bacterium]|nr:hypothetical protein [Vicinamibacterales bacterium]